MTTTNVVPSDRTSVELQGREYGVISRAQERFFQELPLVLVEIGRSIRAYSALLALEDNPMPTKERIFAAYGKDVALFKNRYSEFADCLKQAVRYSMNLSDRSKSDQNSEAERTWKRLEGEMPVIGKAPIMELSYVRAAKEAPVLLAELKAEVNLGIERLVRIFAFWLQELVEAEFIGLVEWTAPDICRYHYFAQQNTAEVLKSETKTEHSFDGSKPLGERNTSATVVKREVKHSRFLVRHVHHIIFAKLHMIGKYRKRKPKRIERFLKNVPKWLKPHLRIVDGTITMEEQVKLKVAEVTTVEEEIASVYKYSPGVVLEPFNIIGWSGDDIESPWRFAGSDVFGWVLVTLFIIAVILGVIKAGELLVMLLEWLF